MSKSRGMVLLEWARARFPNARLGVTGLSWGGAAAGTLGILLSPREDLVCGLS